MTGVLRGVFLASLVLLSGLRLAGAATIGVNTLDTKDGEPLTVIFIDGRLENGDQQKFVNAALRADGAVVVLSSPGGSTIAGIEIGQAIRLKNFATLVLSGNVCASACALAWLGGVQRFMSPGALVGFHATYETQGGRPEVSSVGNAAVGAYLSQLGLPLSAIAYISAAQPSEIQWLSFADANRVGIEVRTFELADNASPSPPNTTVSPGRENWAAQGYWIQLYSRSNLAEAIAIATNIGKQFKDTSVFLYDNGWYVVALGPYPKRADGRRLMDRFIVEGAIPSDSLLNAGTRFQERVWASGGDGTNSAVDAALDAARTFFQQTSARNSVTLAYLDRLYASQVTYYGKLTPKSDVLAEKRLFVERWPDRNYATLPGTLTARCETDGTCSVTGRISFWAYSPVRNQTSSGKANFSLVFKGPGASQLVSETGQVLTRDKSSGR